MGLFLIRILYQQAGGCHGQQHNEQQYRDFIEYGGSCFQVNEGIVIFHYCKVFYLVMLNFCDCTWLPISARTM